jgi:hypothetical protein
MVSVEYDLELSGYFRNEVDWKILYQNYVFFSSFSIHNPRKWGIKQPIILIKIQARITKVSLAFPVGFV